MARSDYPRWGELGLNGHLASANVSSRARAIQIGRDPPMLRNVHTSLSRPPLAVVPTATGPAAGSPTLQLVGRDADARKVRVEGLVRAHLALVGHLVRETLSRVPGHVSHDDLTSAGMLALVQAAEGYDQERGASFATYASVRVRGALLDELRGLDWASRSVRRRARQVDDARSRISTALGRPAEDHEVATALGIGASELAAHRDDLARASVVSLQSFEERTVDELLPAQTVTPADEIEQREQVAYLHDAVAQLPEKLKVVVEGYFFGDRPMADIAAQLGVSESRVSQLRAEAVTLLRGALHAALDPHLADVHQRPEGCAARRKESYYANVAAHRSYAARLTQPLAHAAVTA
jgi:RNA polymerase sigma factor for flagellar operon FliA